METVSVMEPQRRIKSRLTLDVGTAAESGAVLSSPDVRLLQLASPELERLVLQQYTHHHQQQQQQELWTGAQFDMEQSDNGRGFVDALFELHSRFPTKKDYTGYPSEHLRQTSVMEMSPVSVPPVNRRRAASGSTKPSSSETPPLSPIDLTEQERARLERKRERNRMAATRCRNRKLERIGQLQNQADRLRSDNARLSDEVRRLRDIVNQLRHDALLHSVCQPPVCMNALSAAFDENF